MSVEHLVIALAEAGTSTAAGRILANHGVTRDSFLSALTKVRGNQRVTSATPEGSYEALEKYGRDLVAEGRAGKLDPVIGRDAEIRRVVQILSRKTKNNPVLIGDPGVGKTAIVEGLAQRIGARDVPEGCWTRRLFSLDMGSLVAGASSGRVRGAAAGGPFGGEGGRRPNPAVRRRVAHRRRRGATEGSWTPATCSSRRRPAKVAHDRRDHPRRRYRSRP